MPALLLGPMLRHVGLTHATFWVEVDTPCLVKVLEVEDSTFQVSGHHYALICVDGLKPGSVTDYTVELDGEQVWPLPSSADLPSRVATLSPDRPQRIVFGSCRTAAAQSAAEFRRLGVDALEAYADRVAAEHEQAWPDLLLMLGDQVYADSTSTRTQTQIAERRNISQPPGTEVANFEEYTWLYHETWGDQRVRWLMSTVPVAMIFDDHDVRDDWNTSRSWRDDVKATSWWQERIVGALISYWVYQHLGNLSPAELAADAVYARVRTAAAAGDDAEPILRAFALAADAEADGAKGYRWSFWRDLGRTRLVVIDSRCGRMLDGDYRSMLSESEFSWIEAQLDGDYDHLLIGTSLPWLMAPALHAIEAWNEQLAADERPSRARLGEKIRRAADLEHWPAFAASFERLARILADVGSGRGTATAPATICVLSGDVHHSYLTAVDLSGLASRPVTSAIYQVTCSPMRNWLPGRFRVMFRVLWSSPMALVLPALLTRGGRVRRPLFRWQTVGGPFFGNAITTLVTQGRTANVRIESSRAQAQGEPLQTLIAHDLTAAATDRRPSSSRRGA